MAPTYYQDVKECAAQIIEDLDYNITLGIPLGLGKPCQIVNELYRRAKEDSRIKLRIITALSLERPSTKPGLEAKFLEPVFERIFGGYVAPDYARDVRKQCLPENVEVCEFFFKSGSMLKNDYAQQHYVSCNYTHVVPVLIEQGVNLVAQQVCKGTYQDQAYLSLSSNTDTSLDLMPLFEQERAKGRNLKVLAQVNQNLPFMLNKALVKAHDFDYVIDSPDYYSTLFSTPNLPICNTDFAIGSHASALIKDGGTLQIGIGSMGDAIVYNCLLRQHQNQRYQQVMQALKADNYQDLIDKIGGTHTFEQGLYGASEMFVNGFLHLIQNGIVKRKVYDNVTLQNLLNEGKISEQLKADDYDSLVEAGFFGAQFSAENLALAQHFGLFNERLSFRDGQLCLNDQALGHAPSDAELGKQVKAHGMGSQLKHGVYMHGGFFLGPRSFYDSLNNMSEAERELICMTNIRHVNQLLEGPELATAQRQHARFINTGLKATLNGAVASDGLDNNKVLSGVGGQYDFVAMAHQLAGSRSILLIRATRVAGGQLESNVVYNYGYTTIPRHLRDIIITEYGVADLRGKTDQEVIKAMLNIADSRFQNSLLEQAKRHGKIDPGYQIPAAYQNNYPERIDECIEGFRAQGLFPPLPLGTDFTEQELQIGAALKQLKALSDNKAALLKTLASTWSKTYDEAQARPFLERMNMTAPEGFGEKVEQKLLLHALAEAGHIA